MCAGGKCLFSRGMLFLGLKDILPSFSKTQISRRIRFSRLEGENSTFCHFLWLLQRWAVDWPKKFSSPGAKFFENFSKIFTKNPKSWDFSMKTWEYHLLMSASFPQSFSDRALRVGSDSSPFGQFWSKIWSKLAFFTSQDGLGGSCGRVAREIQPLGRYRLYF